MSKQQTRQTRYHNIRKETIIDIMGGSCKLCGYNKCSAALELHHIDPSQKDFTFSKSKNISWEKIDSELQKCILLCANCHREIHYNNSDMALTSSYDSIKGKEAFEKVKKSKETTKYFCKNCGIEVGYKSEYCPTCASVLKRVVERPERDELKKLIREKPFTQIGKMFGVSDNAIRKWCLSYNLPTKKGEIKKYSQIEWEQV